VKDERLKILEMFKEGKISMEEALELLDAFENYGFDAGDANPEPELIDEEEAKNFDFQFETGTSEADSGPSDDDEAGDDSSGQDRPYFKFHMPEIRIPKIEIPPVRIPEIRIPPINIPGDSFFGGKGHHESRGGSSRYEKIVIDSFGSYQDDVKTEKIAISGMGKFAGNVEAGKINISGVGEFNGDILTEKMDVSGNAYVKGAANASDRISVSGMVDFSSSVETGKLAVSGKVDIRGGLKCAEFANAGFTEIDGSLQAKHLSLSGICNIKGQADFYSAEVSGCLAVYGDASIYKFECREGVFEIKGNLNADSVYVELGRDDSHIRGDIRAESLVVKRVNSVNNGKLLVNDIYTVNAELENVKTSLLVGKDLIIGPGCVIDRVEYTGTLNIVDGAVVKEQVKKAAESSDDGAANGRTEE